MIEINKPSFNNSYFFITVNSQNFIKLQLHRRSNSSNRKFNHFGDLKIDILLSSFSYEEKSTQLTTDINQQGKKFMSI
jgi:hypothetical protein